MTSEVKANLEYNESVTISKERYGELLESERFLRALENAGVDNWEWYHLAFEEEE